MAYPLRHVGASLLPETGSGTVEVVGSHTHSPLRFAMAYPLRHVGGSDDSLLTLKNGSGAVDCEDSLHATKTSATLAMMSFRNCYLICLSCLLTQLM
jgi:hypothetical protein